MADTILGVDGNWALHRAFHVLQTYESKDPQKAINQRFVSMICRDAMVAKAKQMLIAFDGKDVFRHKIYKDYKANREHSDGDSPYDYLEGLKVYLDECGLPWHHPNEYEADDVLCSLAHLQGIFGVKVYIATKDKDAFQYMNRAVFLIDSTAKPEPKITSFDDVEAKFGVKPTLCLDLQTLVGDAIDNVPQLVSRARAVKGLNQWGSLKAWLAGDAAFRKELRPRKDELSRNRKLVKLVDSLKVEAKTPEWNSSQDMTLAYVRWKDFANIRSKGLF